MKKQELRSLGAVYISGVVEKESKEINIDNKITIKPKNGKI